MTRLTSRSVRMRDTPATLAKRPPERPSDSYASLLFVRKRGYGPKRPDSSWPKRLDLRSAHSSLAKAPGPLVGAPSPTVIAERLDPLLSRHDPLAGRHRDRGRPAVA